MSKEKRSEVGFEVRFENVIKTFTHVLKQLDEVAAHAVKQYETVPCKLGCVGCCYQMTALSVAEGVLIAHELLKRPDWAEWAWKLRDASLVYMKTPFSREQHFVNQIPCVFLDVQEKKCTMYDRRPAACRFHFVVTPAERCFAESQSDEVSTLNLVELEAHVWEFSRDVFGEDSQAACAPLPLMVLFCMTLVAKLNDAQHRRVEGMLTGLKDPFEWARDAVLNGGLVELECDDSIDTRKMVVEAATRVGLVKA